MLACQYSFGATIGAPVIFFLGQFVFNILVTQANLGDNDTSLALAFGMWYMIIPHISIVSGLLLAGNNPNTLEGVVAHEFGDIGEPITVEEEYFLLKVFELAYNSRYKPQWLWFRGRSKRDWVERVWQTYEKRHMHHKQDLVFDEDMASLREATTPTLLNWGVILGLTLLLVSMKNIIFKK